MDEQDALNILMKPTGDAPSGLRGVGSEEHSAPRRPLISRKQPRGTNGARNRGPGRPRFPQDSLY